MLDPHVPGARPDAVSDDDGRFTRHGATACEAASSLGAALARGDVGASYRPIVHLATGALVGWQAVARWDARSGPRFGADVTGSDMTGSDVTGPDAPDRDLVAHVELLVTDLAIAALAESDERLPASRPTMSVRLSASTLHRADLAERVRTSLDRAGIAAARLVVELAEGLEPAEVEPVAAGLAGLRSLGVRVAMAEIACTDSFARVRGLPLDRLHLGACSTARLDRPDEQAIVRALLSLARDLALDVVADGIGDDRQQRVLRRLGCPLGAGPLFGELVRRPVAPTVPELQAGTARRGYPAPSDEVGRLGVLYDSGMLDSAPEALFDDIVAEAARLCDAPIALVTLVDVERVFFKAAHGADGIRQVGRDVSFCTHTVCEPTTMVVADTLADHRFAHNPMVVDAPTIRFYAGAPLVTSDGVTLGAVCVLDHRARTLDPAQVRGLERLARAASDHIELRARLHQIDRARHDRAAATRAIDDLRRLVASASLGDR